MKFIIFLLGIILVQNLFAAKELCPTVVIHGQHKEIDLSKTEKRLVCGDPSSLSYKFIPPYQAQFFFTAFLQSRGYLRPTFETKNGVLHVKTGRLSRLRRIKVTSENKKERRVVKRELRRRYTDKILAPSLLNTIERRTERILAERGYPCADPSLIADAERSEVFQALNEGRFFLFGEIRKERIPGLRANALDRFYPFDAKDPYNERLLRLTEKRLFRSGVVQGSYFLNNCSPTMDELQLSQFFVLGPPRIVRIGVGISTEQGPMTRLSWSHNRNDSMASVISLDARASVRSQSIAAIGDHYLWKHRPRRSLYSALNFNRESQIDYEQTIFSATSQVKWTADIENYFQQIMLGPNFENSFYLLEVNPNTKNYTSVNLKSSFLWMAHAYEYYDFHPQEGNTIGVNLDLRHPELGFPDPLMKIDSTYVVFKELGFWDEGTVVGGLRITGGSTWVSDDVPRDSLPPSLKFYGGGSDDLRGFMLNTLPDSDGLGALTKLMLKLEVRRTYVFRESIEVFAFMDNGYFGEKSWSLDPRLWSSPGLGARWLSPFGMVQGYIARGLVNNPYEDKGNFYYVGIGGTF